MCDYNMDKIAVKVVVPIYSAVLSDKEAKSLARTMLMLGGRYPVVFLAPEGLDIDALTTEYRPTEVVRVGEEWLGRTNGIAGYNRMCLSREFYDLFADCEYILICQTDVWIFRDELSEWCSFGYDYVGAPWVKRKIYDRPVIRHYLKLRKVLFGRNPLKLLRQDGFDRIGNGGLSLRRVDSFRRACEEYKDAIEYFKAHSGTRFNEDWFWALFPKGFKYPPVEEALKFSFDVKPDFCYELAGRCLPFGCHGWYKKRMYGFWKPIIEPGE